MVYVDVGCRYTTIVLGTEGQLCFVKQIAVGADRFDQVIADKLGVDKAEAHALRRKLQRQGEGQGAARTGHMPPVRHGQPRNTPDGSKLEHSTCQTLTDGIRSVAGELAHEVSRCLRYYTVTFRGQRIHRVVLCGGGTNEGILLDVMRTQLGCDVVTAESLLGFIGTQLLTLGQGEGVHEWVVSVGLALKNIPTADECQAETKQARRLVTVGQKSEY